MPFLPRSLPLHGLSLLLFLTPTLLFLGCGDEASPELEALSLRELLGLSPDRVAELSEADKARFAARLVEGWAQQREEDVADLPPLSQLTERELRPAIEDFDHQRLEAGLDARLGARFLAPDAPSLTTRALEDMGLELNSAGFVVHPLDITEYSHYGELVFDERWSEREEPALGDQSQLQLVKKLEPVFRRLLMELANPEATIQIVPAEGAPLLIWWLPEYQALLVNPNLLYLLNEANEPLDAEAGFAGGGQEAASFWALVSPCVELAEQRCERCTQSDYYGTPACTDSFFEESPYNNIKDECQAFETTGFELYCVNLLVSENLGCVLMSQEGVGCGAEGAPYTSYEESQMLQPFLTEAHCMTALVYCAGDREAESKEPTEPIWVPINDDEEEEEEDWDFADCMAVGCEIIGDIECDSSSDSSTGTSSDSSGLCDGDDSSGGLCDGDDADAPTATLAGIRQWGEGGLLIISPAFLFLWLATRRRW